MLTQDQIKRLESLPGWKELCAADDIDDKQCQLQSLVDNIAMNKEARHTQAVRLIIELGPCYRSPGKRITERDRRLARQLLNRIDNGTANDGDFEWLDDMCDRIVASRK